MTVVKPIENIQVWIKPTSSAEWIKIRSLQMLSIDRSKDYFSARFKFTSVGSAEILHRLLESEFEFLAQTTDYIGVYGIVKLSAFHSIAKVESVSEFTGFSAAVDSVAVFDFSSELLTSLESSEGPVMHFFRESNQESSDIQICFTKFRRAMEPYNHNWTTSEGLDDGGVSTGVGYTISWQRGPLNENGRNGAFLIEVLESCLHQLQHYQSGRFTCAENARALENLEVAIYELNQRRSRRQNEGTLGSTQGS